MQQQINTIVFYNSVFKQYPMGSSPLLPQNSTNLKNRVSKLHLPKTKPLLPLFEILSNAIHAIEEKKITSSNFKGGIKITAIRNGSEENLLSVSNIEEYPIHSFIIEDNGIGLDNENFISFAEFDSDKKAKIGGKGVGRLVCLKAFQKIIVESIYADGEDFKLRKFEYKKTKDGFDKYEDNLSLIRKTGTKIILSKYEPDYGKGPLSIMEIAREIITHFQLYFIQNIQPEIIIKNQNDSDINLNELFNSEFEKEILESDFKINDHTFKVYISKSHKSKSHKIHYCAHERTVKEDGLSKYLEDLKSIVNENPAQPGFYFQVFVVGEFLDSNVNEARTSFNFTIEEENEEIDVKEITLSKIRKEVIQAIESLLSVFLADARRRKMEEYLPIIQEEFPNYHGVVNYNREKVEKLPVGLTKHELDLKLYEIESEWRIKVKTEGIDIVHKKKDITTLEQYKEIYDKFLTEFNEIGQSDLARYVVHRRSVIDLLDRLIELNAQDKFADEEIIHSLFFPIRENGNTILHEKQNLWLIDERLTFNSLLASDKLFKQVEQLNSSSSDRIDLVVKKEEVFDNAALFSEVRTPFESFTIVEFKKPERDDYKKGDEKKDPVEQVRRYIRQTVDGKTKLRGKSIDAKENTPFYCYIIADITPTLKYILEEESFVPTPDGLGYFRFYDTKNYKAYIEVLPFKKIIHDAKQRNKVLFDSLKLT
jgi:hypothetical protein